MISRRYIGFISLFLGALAVVLLFVQPEGLTRKDAAKIRLRKPDKIDKIKIASQFDTVILSRNGDLWQLPAKETVNPVAVENLLFAAERLQVDAVHPDQVPLKGESTRRVSYYHRGRPVLEYATLSQNGHFLLSRNGSDQAYSVSLPGYPELDLNRVFSDRENHYREHLLIDFLPSEIKMIEVEKRGHSTFRFSVDDSGGIICELPQSDSLVPMKLFNEESIRLLFTYFTSIRYEEKLSDFPYARGMDEMENRWLATLYVESNLGETHSLKVYSLPGENGEDEHMFKALVIHNNTSEALVINYIYLDVLMRDLSAYFGDNSLQL